MPIKVGIPRPTRNPQRRHPTQEVTIIGNSTRIPVPAPVDLTEYGAVPRRAGRESAQVGTCVMSATQRSETSISSR